MKIRVNKKTVEQSRVRIYNSQYKIVLKDCCINRYIDIYYDFNINFKKPIVINYLTINGATYI